jgi:hypothetical protein
VRVGLILGGLLLAAVLVPAAPSYDAWAWLLWGREIAHGTLSTVDGPAWKPLPVAITTLLAPLGSLAPDVWLGVARAGALAALALAWVVARRLGGSGLVAVAAVALTGGFVLHAAVGDTEPLLVALMLGAVERVLASRPRQALALAVLACLVRPEAWPFAALFGLWLWRSDTAVRPVLAGLALAVPAAWLVPEWAGSGDLLRAGARARVPNPGQPATEALPALATLVAAAGVVFAPAALAAVAARGAAAVLALGGVAWIALVAAMSQAGFSGEPRYVLPGAALLAVAGAASTGRLAASARRRLPSVSRAAVAVEVGRGLVSGRSAARTRAAIARRWPMRTQVVAGMAASLAVAGVAVAAAHRIGDVAGLGPRLSYQARLSDDLDRAIAAAGGRDRVLACGRPAVGRFRGTLMAYRLDVPKHVVRADGRPADVTFASRLTRGSPVSPPPGRPAIDAGTWSVALPACGASAR